MATQGNNTSRLAQMQMRFQQRQQQERIQRKLEMSSAPSIINNNNSINNNGSNGLELDATCTPGKVRQLFEERRQRSIGIDKSYPLQPIQMKQSPKATSKTPTKTTFSRADNDNGLDNSWSMNDRNGSFNNAVAGKLSNVGRLASLSINNNGSGVTKNSNGVAGGANAVKLRPVIVKKSSGDSGGITAGAKNLTNLSKVSNRNAESENSRVISKSNPVQKIDAPASVKKPTSAKVVKQSGPPPEGLTECKICGRYFAEDRIEKHIVICAKVSSKKRKIFDSTKHRVQGTEAEKYVLKKGPRGSRAVAAAAAAPVRQPQAATSTLNGGGASSAKKSNWRRKHEEFIEAIRAAKQMQAHLAKGGKLSDLPPPPRSENPDYIQCPHCMRRFNEAAANRHIPKCATMLHNKPKPQPPKKRY